MTFEKFIEGLGQSVWLYPLIGVLAILLIILISRSMKRKKVNDRIEQSRITINDLKSHHFNVDLDKFKALISFNASYQERYDHCLEQYERLEENLNKASAIMHDASDLLGLGNFRKANASMDECDPVLAKSKEDAQQLQDVLQTVLGEANMQRTAINNLKENFHNIKDSINQDTSRFLLCWTNLDKLTAEISGKFNEFEQDMAAFQYEKAAELSKDICAQIDYLNRISVDFPQLETLARGELNQQIVDLTMETNELLADGMHEDRSSFSRRVNELQSSLLDVCEELKELKIDNVQEELMQIQSESLAYSNKLHQEADVFRKMKESRNNSEDMLRQIADMMDEINDSEMAYFDRYRLADEKETFVQILGRYQTNYSEYHRISEVYLDKDVLASNIADSFFNVESEIETCYQDCQKVATRLVECQSLERNAVSNIESCRIVLNEVKATLSALNIPHVSLRYQRQIEDGETNADELLKMLNMPSLDINDIDAKTKNLYDAIGYLKDSAFKIMDLIDETEKKLVLCNKYRPYYQDVAPTLVQAELLFRQNKFAESAGLVCKILNRFEPSEATKLQSLIESRAI